MTISVRPYQPTDREAVLALVAAAEQYDGVSALNEESVLALDGSDAARVLVAVDTDRLDTEAPDTRASDAAVTAVLVDAQGDASGCDLVTHPQARRRGAARALLAALGSPARLWAHGDLEPARALARSSGLRAARDLWRMSRPLSADETFDVTLPAGLSARGFDGSDAQAQAWLRVNAAAFASHPEQGRMTMEDFRERVRQPWFDPEGLVLVWDEATGALAASHWTKLEPGSDVGEVYVVAVAPDHQGRGLAAPVTALGLAHLRNRGARAVELYVEGDNEPAKATYRRRGFERVSHDVMYVSAPTSPM